jgi:undecaprenyl diphosphate synthase
MQSTSLHVAIILDGNGRWAERQGLPREAGHQAGAEAVRRIVRTAPALGIGTLTLYAFSSDNWQRPEREVTALLALFAEHLRTEIAESVAAGVRLAVIGRRDRLPLPLRGAIAAAERATAQGRTMLLRLAIDYSARDQILRTVELLRRDPSPAALVGQGSRERFSALLGRAGNERRPAPDVDLLIRTGGERRLSDFLLWECAYAELFFSDKGWPEWGGEDLRATVAEFQRRERRFGGLGSRRTGGSDAAV